MVKNIEGGFSRIASIITGVWILLAFIDVHDNWNKGIVHKVYIAREDDTIIKVKECQPSTTEISFIEQRKQIPFEIVFCVEDVFEDGQLISQWYASEKARYANILYKYFHDEKAIVQERQKKLWWEMIENNGSRILFDVAAICFWFGFCHAISYVWKGFTNQQ